MDERSLQRADDEQLARLAGRRVVCVGLGDLGAALATRLARAGVLVDGVRRGAEAPAGVTLHRGDARDPQRLAGLPEAPDGLVVCVTPSARDEAGYRDSYLAIARALADRYRSAPPSVVLFVSSTAVFAQDGGVTVRDDDATEPTSYRGRVMLEAEAALAALSTRFVALRCSGLYGSAPGRIVDAVRAGRRTAAEPVVHTNRLHREDAVRALAFLLSEGVAGARLPACVLASDPAPTPRAEIEAWLAERLGVHEVRETAAASGADRRLVPQVLPSLGFRFRYPDYRAGFEAALRAAGL